MARDVWMVVVAVVVVASMPAAALPTPGLNGETTEVVPVVGRLFPEALHTNDYIGYFEAVPSLETLAAEYPDRIELIEVGQSRGWTNGFTGQREPHTVYAVEVTNEKSSVPFEDRIHLIFTCSIHGNEKGGREGCMRVVEDFAKEIGMVAEDPGLIDLLDYMVLSFPIPNTDGWTHDEPEYMTNPGVGPMMTRGNANGTDLNRQWPTIGFLEQSSNHQTMREPEIAAVAPFLRDRYPNVWYAADIHGMLTPTDIQTPPLPPENCGADNPGACPDDATEFLEWMQDRDNGHFLLALLPNAQLTQDDFLRLTQFAELVRERTNECPGTLGPAWCQAPSVGPWGGNFNYWGTAWETIGYEASGSTRNFMMSPYGLDAPAATYEMAYNHIVCDGVYPGCGAPMNEFHVNAVRGIVAAYMEAASLDLQVSFETNGQRTGYLFNPKVVSTADEDGGPRASGGWSDENPLDDQWDILHNVYHASPNDYLRSIAPHVRDGDRPGVYDEVPVTRLDAEALDRYDTFVVAGSAVELLSVEQVALLDAWVRAGGSLIVTDTALELLEDLDAVPDGSVRTVQQYAGYTEVTDYDHAMARDLIGYSRQTYDPVAIGIAQGSAPIWVVDTPAAAQAGPVVGVVAPGNQPLDESENANFGEVHHGDGTIRYLGALVPDPTTESYTPYGVASYAVTYAGNNFFLNMLGFDQVFQAPPLVFDDPANLQKPAAVASGAGGNGSAEAGLPKGGGASPGAGLVALAVALMVAAVIGRRRTV